MISTNFESRIKINQIIDNQIPEFILEESPKFLEFLRQYYISQEFEGAPTDLIENLDQYLNFDYLNDKLVLDEIYLSSDITTDSKSITVSSTNGFPKKYGLLKIDDEIITYEEINNNTFIGCSRGFSAITSFNDSQNPEELIFSSSKASLHKSNSVVTNLSSLFLKEFYKKLKYIFAPGFEDFEFSPDLNINTFISKIKSFYQSKGTDESIKILFKVLYNETPKIINLENFLIKPSDAEYLRRSVVVCDLITKNGNPFKLVGQQIKSNDGSFSGPISKVDISTKNNKTVYKIGLFYGYGDDDLIEGNFVITPKTKITDFVKAGASTITVDSTVGFKNSGVFVCDGQEITYQSKSVNQLYGCTGVLKSIDSGKDLYFKDYVVYGYENGDTSKKIEFLVIGSLHDVEGIENFNLLKPNNIVNLGEFGQDIRFDVQNKTIKEYAFNSFIYNVRTSYDIQYFSVGSPVIDTYEEPHPTSLKTNDIVDILLKDTEMVVLKDVVVNSILNNKITLDTPISGILPQQKIAIRRKYNYASSSIIPLKYNNILSNVQNTYVYKDDMYVASNSLPSRKISLDIKQSSKTITNSKDANEFFDGSLGGKYTILSFDNEVPFLTGDVVKYFYTTSSPINGLQNNSEFYVEVLPQKNKIRLYSAVSFLPVKDFLRFDKNNQVGQHKFVLIQHASEIINPSNSLKRISLNQDFNSDEKQVETEHGIIGTLINGVDIINYKSTDKVYYGPLERIDVSNPGFDYDVINPPQVQITSPNTGIGTTAKINLIVEGEFKEVLVDPQQFGIERIISVSAKGGNGKNAVFEPIIKKQYREIPFSGETLDFGGSVDVVNDSFIFKEPHGLVNGQKIVYNSNGNLGIGIGSFAGSNLDSGQYLINGGIYLTKVLNPKSIQIFSTSSDLNSGINTIGITTVNTYGIHKFRLFEPIKVLSYVRIVNPGKGYSYKSLNVNPSGISTQTSIITFKEHRFNDGDLINYSYDQEPIVGLSTNKKYYVLKINDNSFQLSDGGEINENETPISKLNYIKRNPTIISSVGNGYHTFSYPKISVEVIAEYIGISSSIQLTPIVRGKVTGAYLYDPGSDYGSTALNLNIKPLISIKKGSGAQLKPLIFDGKIISVQVQNKGSNYDKSIDLVVIGSGIGCKLRAVVVDGLIDSVIVLNSGIGYDNNTTITVSSVGQGVVLIPTIRSLTVNDHFRYPGEFYLENKEKTALTYGVNDYYSNREGIEFNDPDPNTFHSKIIGWAKDGNPIYGPYGYKDPFNFSSQSIRLKTGYELKPSNINNRPSLDILPAGFFIEDYKFTNSGDLDEHNGRFTKTPEFPNGIYAYFASTKLDVTTSAKTEIVGEFPYFIGNSFRSKPIDNFVLDQNLDLDDNKLLRNTFPYRVNRKNSGNYFLPRNYGLKQNCEIKSIETGSLENINVEISGSGYSVGDNVIFDNTYTDGSGASAVVSSIFNGVDIEEINTTYAIYENVVFSWENNNSIIATILPSHKFSDQDYIQISGLSTSSIKGLNGNHKINFDTASSILLRDLSSANSVGVITDIYLDKSLPNVSIGSSVSIGNENFIILNILDDNILRCQRNQTGISHTASSTVTEIPCKFKINLNTNSFVSNNKSIVYFNPQLSIGVGTADGLDILSTQYYGDFSKKVSIPTRSIYLPNHPFETNDVISLAVSPALGSVSITVSNSPSSSQFSIPADVNESVELYVIKKSKDFIGIVTQIGLTTTSSGLYFISNGSNNYDYKFEKVESTNKVITGTASKIKSKITTLNPHGLTNGESVNLEVIPKTNSGGITTSLPLKVKYNSNFHKLLVDPITFNSSAINTSKNTITILSHKFYNGQKVFYDTQNYTNGGISTGIYYVNKIDSNTIKLCETYYDSVSFPAQELNIENVGGNGQELSLINPQIVSIRNNNLSFDLSDSSLNGYNFNIFYDKQFNKNFVSTGSTSKFNVVTDGIPGTNGSITINYDTSIPSLYYTLTKDGYPIFSNVNTNDYQIIFTESLYNNTNYIVSEASNNSFYVSLNNIPENLHYISGQDVSIRYYTTSKNTTGPIHSIKLLSGGSGYTQLPKIVGIDTSFSKRISGNSALLSIQSNSIGKFKSIEIPNDGFDYPSDKTLRPSANLNTLLLLSNDEEISEIKVVYGGKNYLSKPNFVLVDTLSRKKVSSGVMQLELNGSSVGNIKIISRPKGLASSNHRLYTINNSNGVTITGITTTIDGIVHANIRTPPIFGFSTPPFVPGDYIFVEGVQKGPSVDEFGNVTFPGDGFNSEDHGYNFFKVVEFVNDAGNGLLKYDVSPYTLNPGIPVISQTTYSSAINENVYPLFKITQIKSTFIDGENLYVNDTPTEIKIKSVLNGSINVSKTSDKIKKFDFIKGAVSNSKALISDIFEYSARFNYSSFTRASVGWSNDTGKLNFDTQSLPDNDYYQNLSYSIKSNVEYDKFSEAVNKLVHPIGTKNFGEIGFSSSSKTSIGGTSSLTTVLNLDNESSVDVIKNFDLAIDYDSFSGSSSNIKLFNKKLSNFIECRSNRVLQIDDISNSFSSSEFNKDQFLDSVSYDISGFYSKFLVQVYNSPQTEAQEKSFQLSDLVVLNDFKNTYTLNKSDLYTNFNLGYFEGTLNNVGDPTLRFTPSDPYDTKYELKIYREYFTLPNVTGFGITNYGFLRFFSEARTVKNQIGFTTSVFRALSADYHTIHSSCLVINTKDYSLNYYEVVGTYDGNNTHLSEFYFDSSQHLGGFSGGYIGTFGLVENSGILSLNFTNKTNDNLVIKTKTVAIGKTDFGEGVYRFLVQDQLPESEKTCRIESNYLYTTGISTIKTFDSSIESGLKSLVRVSVGSTVSVYQILVISDQVYTKIQTDPFITAGTSAGLGTFSTVNDGSLVNVIFYPDSKFASTKLLIQSIDHFIYSENDEFNIPEILSYGPTKEQLYINKYGSINNYGKDRLDFDLNWNRIPIFEKTFNPKNIKQLNISTGTFSITNHLFEDNEELIYTPGSTLIGVAASAIGISTTVVGGTYFIGDSIVGFKTVTGIASSEGIITSDSNVFYGPNIPNGTKIVSVGQTYSYFVGSVSSGSTVITGIANTSILKIGSGIFSGNNTQYGTIVSIGINSITSSVNLPTSNNILYYTNNLNYSVTLNNVSTATTFRSEYQVGIITDILPSTVYAKKLGENTFTLTGTKNGIGFTFTNYGSGNTHKLEMKKKLEKTVLTVNGVMQAPLTYTPLTKTLSGNIDGLVSTGTTFISLSGISSIQPIDILKINDEYMTVISVGIGTTPSGPITGIGTLQLCNVNRGTLGSIPSTHLDNSQIRIYKGSYNIVGNKVWFSEAPDGKGNNALFADNYLPLPKSTFNGRVYLRKDYTTNKIYDDISLEFTGIGRTFTLYNQGNIVSDAKPGNSILILNDIFQTPNTETNNGNNYETLTNNGISSIRFAGITLPNTSESFTVDYDINQNDLPRGGILVSLAFTGGYGYAPLIGVPSEVLDIRVGTGGSISYIGFTTSIIVGLAATGVIGVTTNKITGINTSGIKINQKVMNILNKYIDEIKFVPQYVNLKVPNQTNILQFDTLVSGIGSNSITLSKTTTNTSSLTTSFGFDFGEEFRGSGYYSAVSVAIADTSHVGSASNIIANVGSGGSITGFNIIQGGTGYTNPEVSISDPSYQNLPIEGIYRPSIGYTKQTGIGLSLSIEISSPKGIGIGSTASYISNFSISKPGYNFELGDIFTVSGLTTEKGLINPLEKVFFTVTEVKRDTLASWQVGEFDFIDSIKSLQDGNRTRFPLVSNNKLLSFEKSKTDPAAAIIDFSTILLIFINGVMQEPGVSYTYTGGTTFKFVEPPKAADNISIFFYRGTKDIDSTEITVYPSIKPGDTVQIKKNNSLPTSLDQDPRVISYFTSSDTFETGIYFGQGIDELNPKPINLIHQKTDIITNNIFQYKDRDSLEPLVLPTAKVIKSINSSDDEIFVDDAEFFNYEENNFGLNIVSFDALVIDPIVQVSAALTATVSSSSTISDINIVDGGSGYIGIGTSLLIKMNSTSGVSENAIIYATVSSAGTITSPFNIVNSGYGYTTDNPPQIIAPMPSFKNELVEKIQFVEGFAGIITGITTCPGIGTDMAIKFFTSYDQNSLVETLKVGYPIYVFDTVVGNGVTSVNSNGSSIVSIGNSYLDNVYEIHGIVNLNLSGELICNISNNTNISGINTYGLIQRGRFSWGRFSNIKRSSSPISIGLSGYTATSGLSTFPTIQRRGYGLRNLGGLIKIIVE
jgi:hypothetical protein